MSKNFWDSRWESKQIGWDLGMISPPLKEYFDQINDKELEILIPGCGNAYEAEYLFNIGFKNIFIVEISQGAINSFIKRCPAFPERNIFHSDFFELTKQFDLIIEQTFFCALTPDLRLDYVKQMTKLLKQNGKLAGLLFNTDFVGGPPYGGNEEEYLELFSTTFEIVKMEKAHNSIKPRKNKELFIILKKNALWKKL